MSLARSAWARGEQAPGQQDLAGDHVADDPEDLVADVGLEAVDGQDHPARRRTVSRSSTDRRPSSDKASSSS